MASLDSIFLFGRGDRIGEYTVRYKYLWQDYYESYIAADGDGVPSYSVIDSDIIPFGGKWHLFYVSHEKTATVKHATADRLTGPYIMDNNYDDGERQGHEAPNCWKRIPKHEGDTATYVVMFDNYHHRPHNFGFVDFDCEFYLTFFKFFECVVHKTSK